MVDKITADCQQAHTCKADCKNCPFSHLLFDEHNSLFRAVLPFTRIEYSSGIGMSAIVDSRYRGGPGRFIPEPLATELTGYVGSFIKD